MTTTTYSAANGLCYRGRVIGSGYDCAARRVSDSRAILCLTDVASRREWLSEYEIDPNTDLQAMVEHEAACPSLGSGDWVPQDSDDWEALAERWDAAS